MPARHRTIVADPPWDLYANTGSAKGWTRPEEFNYYPTMTVSEIRALDVESMAADDAHLYLWATCSYLRDSYAVAEAWGFRPAQIVTWAKPPRGPNFGGAFAVTTEHFLFCRRGRLAAKERARSTWYGWPRSAHSAKPEAFYDLVETLSPGPYLELFARRQRLGWDTWGDEALSHVEMPA